VSPKSKLPTVAEMHNRIIDLEHQLIIARNLTDRLEGTIAEQKRTSTVLQAAHDALDEQLGDAKQARDRSDAAWKEVYDHNVKIIHEQDRLRTELRQANNDRQKRHDEIASLQKTIDFMGGTMQKYGRPFTYEEMVIIVKRLILGAAK